MTPDPRDRRGVLRTLALAVFFIGALLLFAMFFVDLGPRSVG